MKYLCLSFDDGPNFSGDNTMNNMLDLLEKNNVTASFFLIGNKISPENRKVIERAQKMGCDIQNHSWTHPAMAEMEDQAIREEFQKCDDAIFEITGVRPQFFRPPYISVSDKMFDDIPLAFICGHGCRDWEPDFPAEERLKMMIEGTKDGTIFLLHVNEGNDKTYKTVEKFIPMMKEQGYTFVNLPDLFKLENVNPNGKRECWSFLKQIFSKKMLRTSLARMRRARSGAQHGGNRTPKHAVYQKAAIRGSQDSLPKNRLLQNLFKLIHFCSNFFHHIFVIFVPDAAFTSKIKTVIAFGIPDNRNKTVVNKFIQNIFKTSVRFCI